MSEKELKEVSKWLADNQFRKLSDVERELVKIAIDRSMTIGELFLAMAIGQNKNDTRIM